MGLQQESKNGSQFFVEGKHSLSGTINLQGAKNFALQAMTISLLTEDDVTLTNFPNIGDLHTNLEVQRSLGANISMMGDHTVRINSRDIIPTDIDPKTAAKTTGSRYFIPLLVKRFGRLVTGPSGGDDITGDDRYQLGEGIRNTYRQMGIESRLINGDDGVERYEFTQAEAEKSLRLEERFFGPTVQSLLAHVVDNKKQDFTIYKPSVEPEILATISMLNSMGADIEYSAKGFKDGDDFIHVNGVPMLKGTEFRVMSDPNALVTYIASTLITDGEVTIKGVDLNEKVATFSHIMSKMNADFYYDPGSKSFTVRPSLSRLRPTDLNVDFWPSECHTDWQQLLTPVLTRANGTSLIDENVMQRRFTSVDALTEMGGLYQYLNNPNRIRREDYKSDGLSHTLLIDGPSRFHYGNVQAPQDVRGATSILIAALSVRGRTVINGIEQIDRGMENIDKVLNSLGANVIRV